MFKIPHFKITIFQKLLIGIVAMLMLNAMIAYVGIVSVNRLEKTSETILKESKRYDNLQNLKLNLNELLMPANDYLIHGNKIEFKNFEKIDSITREQLFKCEMICEKSFNQYVLKDLGDDFKEIETLSKKIFQLKKPVGNHNGAIMMEVMDDITKNAVSRIDTLLSVSSLDMKKYLNVNQTINTKASRVIIFILFFIMISLVVGGFFYVQQITKPLESLAMTAKKVTLGDLSTKADVYTRTHDEIDNFANLFNNMIDVLAEKTVSREYFNSIINKIADTLIITDAKGKIMIVNQAANNLLEYKGDELVGKNIKIILSKNKESIDLKEESVQNIYKTYYSKSGLSIPVSFSKSFIYNNENKITGVLYLAFHRLENHSEKQNPLEEEASEEKRNIKIKGEIPLTNRELEIIKLIIADFSSQEIADKLFISIRTVETHRKHIMEKLHTKSIIALVHYATQNGLI
jgi:PAS domain S-box-containing protein